MPVITFRAPVQHASVGQLRRRIPNELATLEVELTDDERFAVCICLTELVTNAITHGYRGEGGNESAELTVSVTVDRDSGRLRLAAFDPGRDLPVERDGGLYELNGRGLALIRAYASALGWESVFGPVGERVGQQVWCELEIESLTGRATATQAQAQPEQRLDVGLQIAVMDAVSAVRAARPRIGVGSLRDRPRALAGTDTAA